MPDEPMPVEAPSTTEGQGPEQPVQPPTPEPVVTPQAETPTWQQELEKADAKDLRRHPRIAGIIGAELQRAVEADRQRRQEEQNRIDREQSEAELLKFLEDNADYLKQNHLKAYDQLMFLRRQYTDHQLGGVRERTRAELATAIGRAYGDVPEWKDLTEADHETLAKTVMGKSEDEVIPLFTRTALDLVAERRTQRKVNEWKEKELTKEREAIRQEEAAKLLRNSEAPDATKSKGQPAAGPNIKSMTDEEFDKYWNSRHK